MFHFWFCFLFCSSSGFFSYHLIFHFFSPASIVIFSWNFKNQNRTHNTHWPKRKTLRKKIEILMNSLRRNEINRNNTYTKLVKKNCLNDSREIWKLCMHSSFQHRVMEMPACMPACLPFLQPLSFFTFSKNFVLHFIKTKINATRNLYSRDLTVCVSDMCTGFTLTCKK